MEKFLIVKDTSQKCRPFGLSARVLGFKIKEIPEEEGVDPVTWVKDSVGQIIRKGTEDLSPDDYVGFTFCSKDFSRGQGTCPKNIRSLSNQQKYTESEEIETHFGFEKVKESEKQQKVNEVFENVALDYDIMNDAMSLGIHRIWKDYFICQLSPTDNTKLLDVAGGTGDIAFRFLNYVENNTKENCHVTICDINPNMLKVGKIRSQNLKHDKTTITWQEGNAEKLPFSNNSFNAYTIAFGIRNCTFIDKVLEEAYRVLQPGGRFMCLEFSHLEHQTAQWVYDQYSFNLIPVLGHLIAGQWKPYQYLVESIRQFPSQEKFKLMIEEAGFRQVTYENLTLGIVSIHSGFKL